MTGGMNPLGVALDGRRDGLFTRGLGLEQVANPLQSPSGRPDLRPDVRVKW